MKTYLIALLSLVFIVTGCGSVAHTRTIKTVCGETKTVSVRVSWGPEINVYPGSSRPYYQSSDRVYYQTYYQPPVYYQVPSVWQERRNMQETRVKYGLQPKCDNRGNVRYGLQHRR